MLIDGGKDIKKAASDVNNRFGCCAHKLNLVVKNGLKIWGKSNYTLLYSKCKSIKMLNKHFFNIFCNINIEIVLICHCYNLRSK